MILKQRLALIDHRSVVPSSQNAQLDDDGASCIGNYDFCCIECQHQNLQWNAHTHSIR